jgi:hypothetical protein
MYLAKTWKNEGESGAIPLNKSNLQELDNRIEGAIGRNFDLRYFYANNICKLNDCNTTTNWVNGAWDNSNGTASGVTNAVRMSLSTIGYGVKYLYASTINHTIASLHIDEADLCIVFYLYIEPTSYSSYLTSSTNLRITIAQDASGTLTNYAYLDIPKASLISGYEAYYFNMSDFTKVGTFNLNNISQGIAFSLTGTKNSGTVIMDLYFLSLIRKDVDTGYPNPFQVRDSSGNIVPMFNMMTPSYIYGGTGLSDDASFLSFQNMGEGRTAQKLMMKLNVSRQKFQYIKYCGSIRNTALTSMVLTYYVDANNYAEFSFADGTFGVYYKVGGSWSVNYKDITLSLFDNFRFDIHKEGNYYTAIMSHETNLLLTPFVMTVDNIAIGDNGDWYLGTGNDGGLARDEIQIFEYGTL